MEARNEAVLIEWFRKNRTRKDIIDFYRENEMMFSPRQKLMCAMYMIGKSADARSNYTASGFISEAQANRWMERNLYDGKSIYHTLVLYMGLDMDDKSLIYTLNMGEYKHKHLFTYDYIDSMSYMLDGMLSGKERELTEGDMTIFLLVSLSENPYCREIIRSSRMLSDEKMKLMDRQWCSSGDMCRAMIGNLVDPEIVTSNSAELTDKFFGYVRPISPMMLDLLIDAVETRNRIIRNAARAYGLETDDIIQEEELTLGELTEGIE